MYNLLNRRLNMINCQCSPARQQYLVRTNELKSDNMPLTSNDYLNIGYMAGRFGINLQNPNEQNPIKYSDNGLIFDINSCTSVLFENNLKAQGVKFDRLA